MEFKVESVVLVEEDCYMQLKVMDVVEEITVAEGCQMQPKPPVEFERVELKAVVDPDEVLTEEDC